MLELKPQKSVLMQRGSEGLTFDILPRVRYFSRGLSAHPVSTGNSRRQRVCSRALGSKHTANHLSDGGYVAGYIA